MRADGAPAPVPADCALSLRGLTKTFADRLAVDGLSFDVESGELFGFLGPNGAGKTTTIKLLVGLLRPTAGAAVVCGHDVVAEPMAARSVIGYVPDHPALYDKLSGREFLTLSAALYGVPRSLQAERLEAVLDTLGLETCADQLVGSYSRGMRQRLALGAALLHDPRVLVLDEPIVGLDPPGARRLKDLLRQLCRSGRTVFLSTHLLEVAEVLCDRVGVVVGGRLVALGTPAELRAGSGDPTLEQVVLRLTGTDATDLGPLLRALAW